MVRRYQEQLKSYGVCVRLVGRFESKNHESSRVRTKEVFSVARAKTIKLRYRAGHEGGSESRVNKASGKLRLITYFPFQ